MNTAQEHPYSEIGAMIRRHRLELDITKSEAARRAGVSRRTWHEVEEGLRPSSSAQTLTLFENVLGLDPGALVALKHEPAGVETERLRRRLIDILGTYGLLELKAVAGFVERGAIHEARADIDATLHDILERLERLEELEAPPDGGVSRRSGRPPRRPSSTSGLPPGAQRNPATT